MPEFRVVDGVWQILEQGNWINLSESQLGTQWAPFLQPYSDIYYGTETENSPAKTFLFKAAAQVDPRQHYMPGGEWVDIEEARAKYLAEPMPPAGDTPTGPQFQGDARDINDPYWLDLFNNGQAQWFPPRMVQDQSTRTWAEIPGMWMPRVPRQAALPTQPTTAKAFAVQRFREENPDASWEEIAAFQQQYDMASQVPTPTATATAAAREPTSVDELIARELAKGNEAGWEQARRLRDFRDQPTRMDLLDRALELARSPGDLYVLEQMYRGGMKPRRGPLPLSPAFDYTRQWFGLPPVSPDGGVPPVSPQAVSPINQIENALARGTIDSAEATNHLVTLFTSQGAGDSDAEHNAATLVGDWSRVQPTTPTPIPTGTPPKTDPRLTSAEGMRTGGGVPFPSQTDLRTGQLPGGFLDPAVEAAPAGVYSTGFHNAPTGIPMAPFSMTDSSAQIAAKMSAYDPNWDKAVEGTSFAPPGIPMPPFSMTDSPEEIARQMSAYDPNWDKAVEGTSFAPPSRKEGWPHPAGSREWQRFQYGGRVPGPIGLPQKAVVHGGEEIVPPGSREWQFLKTLRQGGEMKRVKASLPGMTGIQWPSVQAYRRMTPAERDRLQSEVELHRIPWAEWQARRAQSLGLGQQQRRRATMLPTSTTMRG